MPAAPNQLTTGRPLPHAACASLPAPPPPGTKASFSYLVAAELARARQLFGPLASPHEAAAVIREEFDEFWREVTLRQRDCHAMLRELVQLAAMCQRAAEDCVYPEAPPATPEPASFSYLVAAELARARQLFGPLASPHEAAAVIREEFDEFWREVTLRQRDCHAMLRELVQLAAMCQRAAEDCVYPEAPPATPEPA